MEQKKQQHGAKNLLCAQDKHSNEQQFGMFALISWGNQSLLIT